MSTPKPGTDELVSRAGTGDQSAVGELLTRHRSRLRRMVAVRMDPRVAGRVDPSDVVQEALIDAAKKMPEYARRRPLPFYPWLRQLAWERLVRLHRRHLRTHRRAVTREQQLAPGLSDQSAVQLADRLAARGTSPSGELLRHELRDRVRAALARLSPRDREVLVMRHLEQLSIAEIAAVLGISEGAVKMRRLRAAQRMMDLLDDDLRESES